MITNFSIKVGVNATPIKDLDVASPKDFIKKIGSYNIELAGTFEGEDLQKLVRLLERAKIQMAKKV